MLIFHVLCLAYGKLCDTYQGWPCLCHSLFSFRRFSFVFHFSYSTTCSIVIVTCARLRLLAPTRRRARAVITTMSTMAPAIATRFGQLCRSPAHDDDPLVLVRTGSAASRAFLGIFCFNVHTVWFPACSFDASYVAYK